MMQPVSKQVRDAIYGGTYRVRRAEVQAVRYTGANADEIAKFIGWPGRGVRVEARKLLGPGRGLRDGIRIETLEDGEAKTVTMAVGDWLIHGRSGSFFSCGPDDFEDQYEPAVD